MTADHRELWAAALRADYDDGDLTNIRYADLPILDRLYVRIRASDWATEPMRSHLVVAEQSYRSFLLISHLRWGGNQPWATGTLSVRGSETALSACVEIVFHAPVRTQRAGLNLHHPLSSTIGRPFRWGSGDLSHTGRFPRAIHPQYWDGTRYLPMIGPFDQLSVQADIQNELVFTFRGDQFETEDQRNWTDASFKTYGPPVAGSRPQPREAASRVEQHVHVQILGRSRPPRRKRSSPAAITIGGEPAPPIPPIGATAASLRRDLSLADAIDHVRAEAWCDDRGTTGSPRRMAAMLHEHGIALELALRIGHADPSQITAALRTATGIPLRGVVALGPATEPTPNEVTAMVRACAEGSVRVAAGTAGHFSEVNRARDSVRDADLVVWSTNPQVHACDDVTVMAGAAMVGQTVASATRIWPAKGAAVSPIRLGPPQTADPRAEGPFAAAWLVAVLAGLAGTRCEWITLELPLWTGLEPAAVYHVLRAVRRSRGNLLVKASSPEDPGLAVLAARRPGRPDRAWLLIAELDGRDGHRLTVPGKIGKAEIIGGPRHGTPAGTDGQEQITLGCHEVAAVSIAL